MIAPAEITVAIGRGRNRDGNVINDLRLAELLKVEKEESFVAAVVDLGNHHRAADGKAVIVPAGYRPDQLSGVSCWRRAAPVKGVPAFSTSFTK